MTNEELRDLLRRLAPEAKVAQLRGVWAPSHADGHLDREIAVAEMAHGIGHVARPGSTLRRGPHTVADLANEIQRFLIEETEGGIPALLHEEALAGVQTLGATCFPQAIGLSCTWDPALAEEVGAAVGRELCALGSHMALSPVADVLRDPRWGRVEETYGEDAYLVGTLAAAFVRGLQAQGHAATLKHFLGYAASAGGRNTTEVSIGARELRDVHGLAFEIAIRAGGARGVMAAYPVIDRVAPTADPDMLTGLLREQFGFGGIVVSDYYGIEMLEWKHHVSESEAMSARLALLAGVDADLPAGGRFGAPLLECLARGEVRIDDIDRAVLRVLELKRDLGLFDTPYVDADAVAAVVHTDDHRVVAGRAAARSVVLLTNDGVLPLANPERIAVIGPNADESLALLGDYSYQIQTDALTQITALAAELPALAEIVDELPPPLSPNRPVPDVDPAEHVAIPTLLAAIRARAGAAAVVHEPGTSVEGGETDGIAAAAGAARRAAVAVVAVGDRSGVLISGTVGEGRDGARLELPGAQRALVEAVLDTGTSTIVVLLNGRPFALEWLAGRAAAIVEAWFPGEGGAAAVAGVLFGDLEPVGRLTCSFPAHPGVLPLTYDHVPMEGLGQYYDVPLAPVFPFGHGLTYTTFEYTDLDVPARVPVDGTVPVTFTVANTGDRAGEEVGQVYLRDEIAAVARPDRELRGFARVALGPGERARVSVEIPAELLAFHDRGLRLVVEPGQHRVLVGASAADIRLEGRVELTGSAPFAPNPAARCVQARASVTAA